MTLGALSTSWSRAVGFGALYGVIWWVLGALLIMPLWMGPFESAYGTAGPSAGLQRDS